MTSRHCCIHSLFRPSHTMGTTLPYSLDLPAGITVFFASLFALRCPHVLPETVPAVSLDHGQDEDKEVSAFLNTYIMTGLVLPSLQS